MLVDTTLPDGQPLITLSEACRQLPSKPAPSTLWRWRHKGVCINGRRIKLQCVRVGGQWYTTPTHFAEFIRAQTEAALAPPVTESATERTPQTNRRLTAAGLID
jgi:hypothetical protein